MHSKNFYLSPDELTLSFSHGPASRRFSFTSTDLRPEDWRRDCISKLRDLLRLGTDLSSNHVTEVREENVSGVRTVALVMQVSEGLAIPAYLLLPAQPANSDRAVIAIHGHGSVEPLIGSCDDYHHSFALKLALEGRVVLCPALRGFGPLVDVGMHGEGTRLDYWNNGDRKYSLVTDGLLYGKSLLGATVEDLLRWEDWIAGELGINEIDVAGISYGGDLAITYPVFSSRVDRIFASGTLGSFSVIFNRCYNAPAHVIPDVLNWMDRSDIAGLNAPRPLAVHYGELDVPSPTNHSASFNETVQESIEELREIYRAFGAEDSVSLHVTEGSGHEMDNGLLMEFFE